MGFYAALSRYYDLFFPAGTKQIEFLSSVRPPKGRALDIGAGTGGYAAALKDRGYEVDALEIGDMVPYLAARAEAAGFRALDLDMTLVGTLGAERYQLVYCIGNTVVHLTDTGALREFLAACHGILAPEGVLVIQIVNYDRVLDAGVTELPGITRADGTHRLKRTYALQGETVRFRTELVTPEGEWTSETPLMALRKDVLERMAEEAGFKGIRCFCDFGGEPWQPEGPATLLVAEK